MSSEVEAEKLSPHNKSEDEKETVGSIDNDAKQGEAQGGMGPYLVCTQGCDAFNRLTP